MYEVYVPTSVTTIGESAFEWCYRGVVFCLEFKVGESKILETNIDQVLDYALDLKNFHKFSEGKVIAPILVATNYTKEKNQRYRISK